MLGLTERFPSFNRPLPASASGDCFSCWPGEYYPTGIRTFARLVPTVDGEGRAAARLLASQGRKDV